MLPQEFSFNRWVRSTPGQITLVGLLVIGGYLLTAYTEHVFRVTPYVLLLLCPLLHLFMHGGHAGHNERTPHAPLNAKSEQPQDHSGHKPDISSHPHTH